MIFLRSIAAAALFFSLSAHALVPIPPLSSPVEDLAQILPKESADQLALALKNFQTKHGPTLQFLSVPTLDGEPIEAFSIRVVDQWKLGKKGKDDGVLFVISLADKRMRLEIGRGLEGDIPDALAGRIIHDVVRPQLRAGYTTAAIFLGFSAVAERLGGNLDLTLSDHRTAKIALGASFGTIVLLTLIFIAILIIAFIDRSGGGGPPFVGRGRRGGYSPYYGGTFGGGSGSSWSSGGGGSWGGGGGGFSGGGASGSW